MKIPLNMRQNGLNSSKAAQAQVLEHDILDTKRGDWNAKRDLARQFMPLLSTLAEKRSDDPKEIAAIIEAGQEGLFLAAGKYKKSIGPAKFRIFALGYIEKAMDNRNNPPGFFARLFGAR